MVYLEYQILSKDRIAVRVRQGHSTLKEQTFDIGNSDIKSAIQEICNRLNRELNCFIEEVHRVV